MKRAFSTLATRAVLAALLAPGGSAGAAAARQSYNFQTRMVEQQPGTGEFDGSLQLDISAHGIVSGYYRPADNERFILVTGGLSGEKLWLEIGGSARSPMRFTGTLHGGKIDAVADRPLLDNGTFAALELFAIPSPK